MCCATGETKMKAFNDCLQYYWCYDGVVNDYLTGPLDGYEFDETIQNWASENSFVCNVDLCGAPAPPPVPAPSAPPAANPGPQPATPCCDPNEYRMRAIDDCNKYYWCYYGEPYGEVV